MAAILKATADPEYGARISAVISDKEDAPALDIARAAGVPVEIIPLEGFSSRGEWDRALGDAIEHHAPDLVVLAGFMKILAPETVERFPEFMINTHPALLPAFTGAHAVRDALAHGVKVTGCTVHFVDAGVDTGPIVAQATVEVEDGDTEQSLHERIKVVERGLVVDTVRRLLEDGWTVEGRRVRWGSSEGKEA
ncbi:MAG: phosphoribosylglycinamide formyltransferase [Demequinaceae bacterium]|nr:phosphoribosylglycinamide formyltransferase [Demequinaceae bacterium]